MLRRVPRVLRVAVLGTVLLAVLASIAQSWSNSTPGAGGYVQTQWGPMGPADRNLLVAVRLAGLWEAPTGQQAAQQASRDEVRQVGTNLGLEHTELDQLVREYAGQLGVLLPSSPTPQQMEWMNELTSLTGTEYDRRFVQIVREAHGNVLPVISEVRVGTRNELVREFAEKSNEFVTRHIDYLESTGLVDYEALPQPPSPGLLSLDRGPIDLVVPGLVVLAALLAAAGLLTALRRRPRPAAGGGVPGGPPVTGRAIAAIAAGPAASPARTARARIAAPLPATTTDSGAYRITDTPGELLPGDGRRSRRADRSRSARVDGFPADPSHVDTGYIEPAYGEPRHGDAQYGEAGYADAGYADAGYADAGYADAGYADAAYADAAYADDVPPETPAERTGPVQRVRRSRARHSVRT